MTACSVLLETTFLRIRLPFIPEAIVDYAQLCNVLSTFPSAKWRRSDTLISFEDNQAKEDQACTENTRIAQGPERGSKENRDLITEYSHIWAQAQIPQVQGIFGWDLCTSEWIPFYYLPTLGSRVTSKTLENIRCHYCFVQRAKVGKTIILSSALMRLSGNPVPVVVKLP